MCCLLVFTDIELSLAVAGLSDTSQIICRFPLSRRAPTQTLGIVPLIKLKIVDFDVIPNRTEVRLKTEREREGGECDI